MWQFKHYYLSIISLRVSWSLQNQCLFPLRFGDSRYFPLHYFFYDFLTLYILISLQLRKEICENFIIIIIIQLSGIRGTFGAYSIFPIFTVYSEVEPIRNQHGSSWPKRMNTITVPIIYNNININNNILYYRKSL